MSNHQRHDAECRESVTLSIYLFLLGERGSFPVLITIASPTPSSTTLPSHFNIASIKHPPSVNALNPQLGAALTPRSPSPSSLLQQKW
ncbi:hypothetical protein E2C01_042771 [Portunus trituberculatus]|uniref:Uncharacterized protein n=1 Tax=Portunus trituberculatus TaxID=210409 RepID=A0A5B7FXE9_PORTR|nr:hypothetical protein [Portunus trituberculatus]